MNRFLLVLLILLSAVWACAPTPRGPASAAELRQALERAPAYRLQVARGRQLSADDHPETSRGSRINARTQTVLKHAGFKWSERAGVEVSLTQGIESGPAGVPRVIVGWVNDPALRSLLKQMGVSGGARPTFAGQVLEGNRNHWVIRGEDPERPGLPIAIYLARSWKALEETLESLTLSGPKGVSMYTVEQGFQSYDLSGRLVHGAGVATAEPEWIKQPGTQNLTVLRLPGVLEKRAARYRLRVVKAMEHVREWSAMQLGGQLELYLLDTGAALRERTGDLDLCVAFGIPGQLHVLLAKGMPDDGGAGGARWAAIELLGAPSAAWLTDGVGVDGAGLWWGRDLVRWGAYLLRADLLPSCSELLYGASASRLSQHQLAPGRGLLFRYLREQKGSEFIVGIWQGDRVLEANGELDREFRAWLSAHPIGDVPARTTSQLPADFLVGVALDSNLRLGGGIDGPGLLSSMELAKASGVNSVSITGNFTEEPGSQRSSLGAGRQCMEGDAALAFALVQARLSGLRFVTLQTSFLISPSAGYSAWQRRTGAAHWNEFFDGFDPAMVHFSLLGELCSFDLLSMGAGMTRYGIEEGLAAPDLEVYDTRWSQAIGLARSAFHGQLTYTADFQQECAAFRHWDQLDFIGISYFPRYGLFGEPAPRPQDYRFMWDKALEGLDGFSEKYSKPVLLMEWGVRSVQSATSETSLGTGPVAAEVQREYYAQMSAALAERRSKGHSGSESLSGSYAWKWSAHPHAGGTQDRGYLLQGKPASQLLSTQAPAH